MLRLPSILCILMLSFPALCQSAGKYQVGTITEVKTHQSAEVGAFDDASYDVSLKVGSIIYTVLYRPMHGEETVKYVSGRDLVVLVGETTVQYTDILGQSHELPIESRKPAANAEGSKADAGKR